MLYNEDICNLPIEKFTKENTIVAIWCTNSLSHIDAIKSEFLPKWNLKLIATWFWVKVVSLYSIEIVMWKNNTNI